VLPGVEVHAQVLESALTRMVLSQPNYAIGAELLIAMLFCAAIIWLAPILGAMALLAFGAVIVASMVATSWYFFAEQRLLIDFTFPLLASTTVYLVLVFSAYVREQTQRRRIRSAFGRYLSPALVQQLAYSRRSCARRRGARHDHHVQRRARLHLDLGVLQARPAGPDLADETGC